MTRPRTAHLLLAALLPTAWGADAELQATVSELHAQGDAMQAEVLELETSTAPLGSLPEAPFVPGSPMPHTEPGQSAAVADGGMIIDNERSRLVYIGNVRLSDPYLQLRAARRLYLSLPKQEKTAEPRQPATPARPGEAPPAPADAAATPAPAAAEAEAPIPARLTVESAAVDAPGSRVLLEGLPQAQPSLLLTRGDDLIILHPAEDGTPARVFANAEGQVLAEGGRMVFIWHDDAGRTYKLDAATGPVIYSAREQRLTVLGHSRLTSETAEIECDEQLEITFAAAAPGSAPARAATSPFSAFSGAQFSDIAAARATGHVVLTTPATPTRPAGTAKGDTLTYLAEDSSCTLSGRCALTYGGFSLHETDDTGNLRMTEDGSITLSAGAALAGTYERAADAAEAPPLTGTWQSGGSIHYSAAENSITFPGGFRAADAQANFSCSSLLKLFLEPSEHARPLPVRPGLPSLVIAQQGGVRRVEAEGEVQLHAEASGRMPACDLSGDTLVAVIPTGEATLTAAAGSSATARYGEYDLTAHSAAQGQALISLSAAGDITATGEQLTAALPTEKGTVRATCTEQLLLQRSEALLTLGPGSRIESPEGILTARAPLQAELYTAAEPARAPKGYPQLSYNFTGLRRAFTAAGGTLRTTQASLQCEGQMELELKQDAPGDDPRRILRSASARDRVAIAGRDASGRLMRANGDRLDYDPATGNFYLRGSTVSLIDRFNTHTASGAGACVTIDPRNNVRITGQRQTTTARDLPQQLENNKKK